MVVNTEKTSMLCVSDLLAYEADTFILDADQNRIGCQNELKALGMYFSNKPDMWEHVKAIRKKIRARFWMLRNLKKSGFNSNELVTVYNTMVRPVADYAAVVYHPSLTDQQDELLENLQNTSLKCICCVLPRAYPSLFVHIRYAVSYTHLTLPTTPYV